MPLIDTPQRFKVHGSSFRVEVQGQAHSVRVRVTSAKGLSTGGGEEGRGGGKEVSVTGVMTRGESQSLGSHSPRQGGGGGWACLRGYVWMLWPKAEAVSALRRREEVAR